MMYILRSRINLGTWAVFIVLVFSFQNELAIEQDATKASNCYVILESLY